MKRWLAWIIISKNRIGEEEDGINRSLVEMGEE